MSDEQKLTLEAFNNTVSNTLLNFKYLRYGQVLFNTLYLYNPSAADQIRGTKADPFYATDKNDTRITEFFLFLEDLLSSL